MIHLTLIFTYLIIEIIMVKFLAYFIRYIILIQIKEHHVILYVQDILGIIRYCFSLALFSQQNETFQINI